jgi:hypothetical protein
LRELLKNFKTVRRELLILLALSIFTYFLIELYLIDIPEIFKGGYQVGQFMTRVCQSYVSAFIFYFIVVHIKNENDKRNINEYVGYKVHSILTSAHLFIQPLQQKVDKKASFKYMTKSELGQLLRSINRNAQEAPYIIGERTGTWMEWYEYLKESSLDSLKEIFVRLPYLDSELVKRLTRIENSLFFKQWELLYHIERDQTFGIYEFQIGAYLNLIKDLEDYAEKKFPDNKFMTSEFIGHK